MCKVSKQIYPESIKVHCNFQNDYVENILKAGVFSVLGIQEVVIEVYESDDMVNKFSTVDIKLEGFLVHSPIPHSYVIYLRSGLGRAELLDVLSHELCHLKQYENGDLSTVDNKTYFWKGEKYDNKTEYFDRPWEKEAFKEQRDIKKQIKKLIK